MKYCYNFLYQLFLLIVAAQEVKGPGIVIAHPGQDIELLCTLTSWSQYNSVGWMINHMGPYGINSLHNGILVGYTATLGSNNIVVKNIIMNDIRNDSLYTCVIVSIYKSRRTILKEGSTTLLYVAGKYVAINLKYFICMIMYVYTY